MEIWSFVTQVINAGNFWAHPVAGPRSEFQDFMGKLNDHFRKDTNSQANDQVEKGQVSVYKLMYYSLMAVM